MTLIFIIFLLALTSACDTLTQLLLKTSINFLNPDINSIKTVFGFIVKLISIPKLWIGFIFSCVSLIVWLFVLSKVDLNFAFSVDSMHYIFIAFASRLILKEKVGVKRWLGTIFIVVGIFLVSLTKKS